MSIKKLSKLFVRAGFCFTIAFLIAMTPVLSPIVVSAQEVPDVEDVVVDTIAPQQEAVPIGADREKGIFKVD